MNPGKLWVAGFLAVAIASVAMVAVACGSAEPEPSYGWRGFWPLAAAFDASAEDIARSDVQREH